MMTNVGQKKFHPGFFLKQDLDALEMQPAEFAKRSGILEKQVSELLNEKISVTQVIAEKLASFFGTSIQLWLGIQSDYDVYKKSSEQEKELISDYKLLMQIDKTFREKYILLEKTNLDASSEVVLARKVLQTSRLSYLEQENLYAVHKELRTDQESDFYKNIWLTLAIKQARQEDELVYNYDTLLQTIPTLRALTLKNPNSFIAQLQEILKKVGIHFVYLDYLRKSNLFGATKWIDNEKSPMIAVSNRGHSNDVFWFSVFHELAHVIMNHKKNLLTATNETANRTIELEADKKAADLLISPTDWNNFIADGNFSKESIMSFSKKIGIQDGIVVGRLQREGKIDHSYLNSLKQQNDFSSNNNSQN
jgi:addiction module HigA family antidote